MPGPTISSCIILWRILRGYCNVNEVQNWTCKWDSYWIGVAWTRTGHIRLGYKRQEGFLSEYDRLQVGNNGFGVDNDKWPYFYAIVNSLECTFLYPCPQSHLIEFYHNDEKERLDKAMRTEKFIIPPDTGLICHGYLQHAGGEWQGKYCIHNHIYLIREVDVNENIALVSCNDSRKPAKSIE